MISQESLNVRGPKIAVVDGGRIYLDPLQIKCSYKEAGGIYSMSEVIVITSGKGGVGKTTTTANVGAGLSKLGKKVVIIDLI